MKKLILFGVITALLMLSVGIVMAKKSVEKKPCDDWPAATCAYTPSGNIHVWYGDDHAICMPMERFNKKALTAKLTNGWYESVSKEGYICKWSYYSEPPSTVINFDDLSVGQYGNNLIFYDGVTFSTEGTAYLVITDESYDRGYGIEHSLPNKLSVFNPPSDLWIQFDYPVNSVGFWLSGAYKTRIIYAYDSDDNEVVSYTQLYPMEEPSAPDGTPWDFYYDRQEYYINLQGDNITKVLIQAIGYDGFSIDDLTYSSL